MQKQLTYPLRSTIFIMLAYAALITSCTTAYPGYGTEGWEAEDAYWRTHYMDEPYYISGYGYEPYRHAYLYGVESYNHYHGRPYEELNDRELRAGWEKTHRQASGMEWEHARAASHAAYMHMSHQHAADGGGHGQSGRR